MEQFYAVQWQNPKTYEWEVCRNISTPEIYMIESDASDICEDWRSEDVSSTYRVGLVEVTCE